YATSLPLRLDLISIRRSGTTPSSLGSASRRSVGTRPDNRFHEDRRTIPLPPTSPGEVGRRYRWLNPVDLPHLAAPLLVGHAWCIRASLGWIRTRPAVRGPQPLQKLPNGPLHRPLHEPLDRSVALRRSNCHVARRLVSRGLGDTGRCTHCY